MKVLIVDDDDNSRVFLERSLRAQNYDIESAANGVIALEKARQWRPDLIISDILMPEMNGFELCRIIKTDEQLRKIPFIFYTGTFVDKNDERLAMSLGASRFLIKPMEPADFFRIIEEVIKEYEMKELSVPYRPLAEMKDLWQMQQEALQRKLDKKMRELDKERKALRESEERFRALIESTSDWIWETDRDGVYTYCSPKIKDILGYEPEEVLGKTPFDLMPPDEAQRISAIFRDIVSSRKPFSLLENINLQKNGKQVVLETSGVPFCDVAGNLRGYRGIDRDITERKRTEIDIRKLNQALERRAAELEMAHSDMESYSYAASHDLKAPLRRIIGFSKILLEEHANNVDEGGKNLLRRIADNTEQMRQVVEDLLQFSSLTSKKIEKKEIPMEALVRSIYEEIKPRPGERNIQLELKKLPEAYGDLSLIRHVVLNLLSNAIKFTRQRETAIIEVDGYSEKNENIYYVRDNGMGFDMRFADKLFRLFQKIHISKQFEGTGTGLVIAKRIIELHEGRVWAEGKPGEGATFYFSLPHKAD